ncbi:hypothetical protein BG011_006157 [Mortierella polycephala]|uniref:FAD-binding domain-containing protein n=1 Tax=Mortierella polycephala TaxID=41804 RepID=A0A9P6PTI8_9FUNG|nr:hypothetical protein BG011_006157 [Mortierella polycephala]
MDTEPFKPTVLIVGAGLGGLTLGAILERAGVPYEIFEKASVLKPTGSAISLGPGVMPMLAQLGILDQIAAKGLILNKSYTVNEQMKLLVSLDYATGLVERFGWPSYVIARPALHHILLNLIPPEKVHLNKRVLSHVQTREGIFIRTSDKKTHQGHILVGADGGYSAVRQELYDQLDKRGELPEVDKKPMTYESVCLVGQTRPMSEDEYAHINDNCVTFTTAERTVCWMVVEMLNKETGKAHNTFRSTEWGPEASGAMCDEVRDFPIRKGMTMGYLIDRTPKEVICKVVLEEKLFQTWTSGRTVLMGDACHKMTPAAGLGARSAMNDAVVLANYINTLETNDIMEIERILKEYKDDRYEAGKDAVKVSSNMMRIIKHDFMGTVFRKLLHNAPRSIWHTIRAKSSACRPQISFLPLVEDRGTCRPLYQPSLEKTRPKDTVADSEIEPEKKYGGE